MMGHSEKIYDVNNVTNEAIIIMMMMMMIIIIIIIFFIAIGSMLCVLQAFLELSLFSSLFFQFLFP
jgi:membrane protein YqaA with SNARE-associated domain